jgi:Ni,Fe-hydrogenase III component G
MKITGLDVEFTPLAAPVPIGFAKVTAAQWQTAASAVRECGGRLLALWASSAIYNEAYSADTASAEAIFCSYATTQGAFWLALPLQAQDGRAGYPDLSDMFSCANRMQRTAADLSNVHAEGAPDTRPWFNHGAWAPTYYPLLQDPLALPPPAPGELTDYPFVAVGGDGVHEIAVGPVHAGIIEPGHFRFSVVGEQGAAAGGAPGLHPQRASSSASRNCRRCRRTGWPGACRATAPWPTPGPIAWRWNPPAARPCHRARCGCAR